MPTTSPIAVGIDKKIYVLHLMVVQMFFLPFGCHGLAMGCEIIQNIDGSSWHKPLSCETQEGLWMTKSS